MGVMKQEAVYTLFAKARFQWGTQSQLVMGLEECAELQKEICKVYRGDYSLERQQQLAEEIADVELMCDQLKYMFELDYSVETFRNQKLKRLAELLEK
jgi:NTP pyrophosphatase (non-canonical NTP hydrolase)